MENRQNLEIGEGCPPLGHSLVLDQQSSKPKELNTFSVPRSSLFSSLSSFLPQFKESCEMMEREIETTGVNSYCLEEVVTSEDDSSSEGDSSEDDSSNSSSMSQESNDPKVEMTFAMAPLETVDLINSLESALPDPTTPKDSLVKEL